MDVPVEDRHAPEPELSLSVAGGDGGVVEDAEAHRPRGGARDGRGAGRARSLLRRPPRSRRRRRGGRPRSRVGRRRVGVQPGRRRDRADELDVLRRHGQRSIASTGAASASRQAGNASWSTRQPLRRLRMVARGMKRRERLMTHELDGGPAPSAASAWSRPARLPRPHESARADASAHVGD
jgi:hypothetical protein